MKKNLVKKIISTTIICSLFLGTIGSINAFTHMDVCNNTEGGDSSGNYYDGFCSEDGSPAGEQTPENIISVIESGDNNTNDFTHRLMPNTEKLVHVPMWLASEKVRNATKDRQLCKIASSFDILNDDGTLKYTYYPQGCQPEKTNSFFNEEFGRNYEEAFSPSEEFDNNENELDDEGTETFLDDIFGDSFEEDFSSAQEFEPSDIVEEPEFIQEGNLDGDLDTGDDDLNELFGDIFGFKINNELNKTEKYSDLSLKGKQIASSLRNYVGNKIKVKVGSIKANFINNNNVYNEKMATLLNKVEDEFKIDSIKNDFAKNVSNVSYSLSSYENTEDEETKEIFRKKLINDLNTLKKKYKKLKFKDGLISKNLEKRGLL